MQGDGQEAQRTVQAVKRQQSLFLSVGMLMKPIEQRQENEGADKKLLSQKSAWTPTHRQYNHGCVTAIDNFRGKNNWSN